MWKWILIVVLIVTVLLCFQSCWWLKPGKKYKCLTRDGVDEYGNKYSKLYSQLSKTYKENSQKFDTSECYVIRFTDLPEAQKYPLDELACVDEKELEGILLSENSIEDLRKGGRYSSVLLQILHKALTNKNYRKYIHFAPDHLARKKYYIKHYKDPFLQLIGYDEQAGIGLFIDIKGKIYVDPYYSDCYRVVNQ